MTRVVLEAPVHLTPFIQNDRVIVLGFHPIVTLRREARNDR